MSAKWLFLLLCLSLVGFSDCETTIDFNNCLPANICDSFTCPTLTEPCKGQIIQGASVCGCCEECVRFLGLGEDCLKVTYPAGGKPLAVCKEGTECDHKTGTCIVKLVTINSPCLAVKERIQKAVDDSPTWDWWLPVDVKVDQNIWTPDCDYEGKFKAKQCKDKKCFCLDPFGERIFGQSEIELSKNMTCSCSRAVRARQLTEGSAFMTQPHERCNEKGDYEELQCIDEVCYCADELTGKPIGHMVRMEQVDFLPCYKPKTVKQTYLTLCEKQAIREKKIYHEFIRKGIAILGYSSLSCDYDGNFSPTQCGRQLCHCTDRTGLSLKSYSMDRVGRDATAMTCRCARDELDNERHGAQYPRLKCGGIGEFSGDQCFDKDCWCMDEDGDRITERTMFRDGFGDICKTLQNIFRLENLLNPKLIAIPPPPAKTP